MKKFFPDQNYFNTFSWEGVVWRLSHVDFLLIDTRLQDFTRNDPKCSQIFTTQNFSYFNFYFFFNFCDLSSKPISFTQENEKQFPLSLNCFPIFSLTGEYKVYARRWIVLAIFVFYSASNAMQWIQFSIIANVVQKYVSKKQERMSEVKNGKKNHVSIKWIDGIDYLFFCVPSEIDSATKKIKFNCYPNKTEKIFLWHRLSELKSFRLGTRHE